MTHAVEEVDERPLRAADPARDLLAATTSTQTRRPTNAKLLGALHGA